MAEKRNIFLIGPMGAGKSTIGRELAERLHLEFFDSDQEIERRTGADIAWVFDLEGEEGFRKREEEVIEDLSEKQGIVFSYRWRLCNKRPSSKPLICTWHCGIP